MHSSGRGVLAPLLAIAAFAPLHPALADVVEIAWSPAGSYKRTLAVPGGKFAELCGKLGKGQTVAWRYEAGVPLAFNIHYHVGSDVVYPVRQDVKTAGEGTLVAPLEQDYCWMWTNGSTVDATVRVTLKR